MYSHPHTHTHHYIIIVIVIIIIIVIIQFPLGQPTITLIGLADFPGGRDVPRPAGVFADVHRPPQGVQELQELRLHVVVRRLQQTARCQFETNQNTQEVKMNAI